MNPGGEKPASKKRIIHTFRVGKKLPEELTITPASELTTCWRSSPDLKSKPAETESNN
jgi:hypothetical protein